ncbi:MAG TPA: hypothetical protein P5319_09110 [Gemmatimonadales bacterium]|nr:hypothetical protein [Gemmatimonadales bacterium]
MSEETQRRKRGRPSRKDYLTPNEAAAEAAAAGYVVSGKTLMRALDAGRLAGYRTPGGYRRIRRASLEEYLRQALDTQDKLGYTSRATVTDPEGGYDTS